MTPEAYHVAGPVKNDLISRLERDLAKIGKQEGPIFMSFIGDPCEDQVILSEAFRVIGHAGCRVRLLTKQRIPAFVFDHNVEVGVTLTCLSDDDTARWEPWTTSAGERLQNLEVAHDRGLLTFASCEPVIDPGSTLKLIQRAAPYCDVFAIGHSNHLGSWNWPSPEEEARVRGIDWRQF
jgi:DNA repair photolyase